MANESQEFYMSVAILGGIITLGVLVIIGLSMVAIGVYNKVTKKQIIKELYDGKEKNQNGKAKGDSRGSW